LMLFPYIVSTEFVDIGSGFPMFYLKKRSQDEW